MRLAGCGMWKRESVNKYWMDIRKIFFLARLIMMEILLSRLLRIIRVKYGRQRKKKKKIKNLKMMMIKRLRLFLLCFSKENENLYFIFARKIFYFNNYIN